MVGNGIVGPPVSDHGNGHGSDHGERGKRRTTAGLTLVELLIALAVLLTGLGALLQSLVRSFELTDQSREMAIATQATRAMVEDLRTEDIATAFVLYNDDAGDDPVGGAPGSAWAVDGLDPSLSDADGLEGEILFPTDPGDPGVLTELAGNGFPGMPRDLNLDGDSIDADVTADFVLLPAVIRLRWRSPSGTEQTYEVRTILSDI